MYLSILLLISIFLHHVWFFSSSILTSGDWGFYYQETMRSFLQFPSIWTPVGLGSVDLGLTWYPIGILWGLLGYLCDYGCAERIIYIYPSIIFAIVSSYILAKKITSSDLASTIGSLFYTYNTYFIIGRTSHLPLMVSFALSPLAFYLIIRIAEKRETKILLLFAILNIVISFYEFRAWYILSLLEILGIFFYSYCGQKIGVLQFFKRVIPQLLAIGSVILINLYWLISFSKSSSLTTNQYFSRGLFGDSFLNINNALSLFHPFWTGRESTLFIVQEIQYYFWVIPIVAFLGLYLNRKNKHVLFFGIVTIIGILLSKQSGVPFKSLYRFLYDHFPGFNALREASKFFFYIALGYSLLIASFVKYLLKDVPMTSIFYKSRMLIITIVMVVILLNLKPIAANELGTLLVPRSIPNDYLKYKSYINSQDGFTRTMWVPRDSRWTYYSASNPSYALVTMFPNGYFSNVNKEQLDFIKSKDFKLILDLTATKYIVIPLEDTENDDNFFKFYSDRKTYLQTLAKLKYLKKINIGTSDLEVYEYLDYKNHVYADSGSVDFVQKKPYLIEVNLKRISRPTVLSFAESYHPGWKAYIGTSSFSEAFLKKNYLESKNVELSNLFQNNSFIIDPEKIKKEFRGDGFTKNTDGSVNLKITIFFRPEIYIFIGLCISTVVIVGSLVLFILFRRYKK